MKNGNYEYCKELARQVLSDHGVTELPVNVHSLCRQQGIRLRYYATANTWQGLATFHKERPHILLRGELAAERERYVIAHELGHLWHGHAGAWGNIADRSGKIRRLREREATEFAMELLMPQHMLVALGVCTAEQIQQLCGVSYPLAVYRLKQLLGVFG